MCVTREQIEGESLGLECTDHYRVLGDLGFGDRHNRHRSSGVLQTFDVVGGGAVKSDVRL